MNTNLNNYLLAVSSDSGDASNNGKIAVAGATSNGEAQVLIIGNTTARAITGIIYFNAMNGPGCTNGFIYPASVVTSMTWLSNTKLLIALQTSNNAEQGLYIFDTSATQTNTGVDDKSCVAAVSGPKQTGSSTSRVNRSGWRTSSTRRQRNDLTALAYQ